MKRTLRENGLSLVLFSLFLITWILGQALAGHSESNADRAVRGLGPETLGEYLTSAHFLEATSENWESEFLQMGVYVALTVFLFQKGSSESKSLEGHEAVDQDPRTAVVRRNSPWPVKRGGWLLTVYEYSLTLAFLILFLICFSIHAVSGCANYNEERAATGLPAMSWTEYLQSSRFWFESLQNWQSEFLAIFSMVVLSIFLRQRGSPESKPVHVPHAKTGK